MASGRVPTTTSTLEVRAGDTSWTDATLSVSVVTHGDRQLLAVDCTHLMITDSEISSEISSTVPMTIFYNEGSDSGTITATDDARITFPNGSMSVHAGEFRFTGLTASPFIERSAFLSTVRVLDVNSTPVRDARVLVNGRFVGTTGDDGNLPIRWNGEPPTVRVVLGAEEATVVLTPGTVTLSLSGT